MFLLVFVFIRKHLGFIKFLSMYNKAILDIKPLGFMWVTQDPFLFCAHHKDAYPIGNEAMEPVASLQGRNLGQDFTLKDGWRMYHGTRVPGFPSHPHRGFETVTIVLEGFVDHSDSHGASGRYGEGDVQWMTAGSGLQHSEMFPLIHTKADNPLELFQVWLNLPAVDKFVKPHFTMLWNEEIPLAVFIDERGKTTKLRIISGKLDQHQPPPPAPDSWAAKPENEVAIQLFHMEKEAHYTLPATVAGITRTLYFYRGESLKIAGMDIPPYHAVNLLSDQEAVIECGDTDGYLLLLQGRPINEPVVQHGSFVMNSHTEINQAISDYHRTEFGGWPWNRNDNVHDRNVGRFARYADGKTEKPAL